MGFILSRVRELRRNQTPQERKMWEILREYRAKGYAFRRQYPVGKHYMHGVCYYYVADFCCKPAKLIVEIDGLIHDYQQEQDMYRQQLIESRGFTVIRFTNEEVDHKPIQVCRKIESFLPGFNS